jgi:hypothetical protein
MVMIRFKGQLAVDPATAMPRPELVGLSGQVVQEGTTTPVAIYEDHAMTLPIIDSTLVITSNAVVPQFYVEDTYELDWWDGTNRVALDSNYGAKTAAQLAQAAAEGAAAAASAEVAAEFAVQTAAAEAAQAAAEAAAANIDAAGVALPLGGEPGDVLYRASAERTGEWGPPIVGGEGTTISGAPSVWPTTFPPDSHTTALADLRKPSGSSTSALSAATLAVLTAATAGDLLTAVGGAPSSTVSYPGAAKGVAGKAMPGTATFAANEIALSTTISGITAGDVQGTLAELAARPTGGGGSGATVPTGVIVAVRYTTTQPTRASLGLRAGDAVDWCSPTSPIIGGAYADVTLDFWTPTP